MKIKRIYEKDMSREVYSIYKENVLTALNYDKWQVSYTNEYYGVRYLYTYKVNDYILEIGSKYNKPHKVSYTMYTIEKDQETNYIYVYFNRRERKLINRKLNLLYEMFTSKRTEKNDSLLPNSMQRKSLIDLI
jgi:hypothetical protein